MKLHKRMIQESFWNDPDLDEWSIAKKMFYIGLWQLADDAACLEYRPITLRKVLFGSYDEITVALVEQWLQEMVADKRIVPYQAEGKLYCFLRNFHKHQQIRSPRPPECPLPSWETWTPFDSNKYTGKYDVYEPVLSKCLDSAYEMLRDYLKSATKRIEVNIREEKLSEENITTGTNSDTGAYDPSPSPPPTSGNHQGNGSLPAGKPVIDPRYPHLSALAPEVAKYNSRPLVNSNTQTHITRAAEDNLAELDAVCQQAGIDWLETMRDRIRKTKVAALLGAESCSCPVAVVNQHAEWALKDARKLASEQSAAGESTAPPLMPDGMPPDNYSNVNPEALAWMKEQERLAREKRGGK